MSETNVFGIDRNKLAKLKARASDKDSDFVTKIRSIKLEPLTDLKTQKLERDGREIVQFGYITPEEASRFAKITEATGSRIIVVGSGSSDPEKLMKTRSENGDVVATATGEAPRPLSDYDVLIEVPSRDTYLKVCAYVEQNIIQPKQSENPNFRADYLYGYSRTFDHDRPHTVFQNGGVTAYSEGKDTYYSLHGGAAKPKTP